MSNSHPLDCRLACVLPLALMALLLLLDPTALDFAVQRLVYREGEGFVGRHSFWLENILHDRAKQALIGLAALFAIAFLLSLPPTRLRRWRRHFAYPVLAISLSTAVVPPLKQLSGVHCPWSLQEFGGSETYTPLLAKRAPTLKSGRCWPGGHAAAGFSLFALYFVLRDLRPRAARFALAFAFVLGSTFAAGRIAQGAHFLSHNVGTMLIDWMICLLCYRLLLWRADGAAASRPTPAAGSVRGIAAASRIDELR